MNSTHSKVPSHDVSECVSTVSMGLSRAVDGDGTRQEEPELTSTRTSRRPPQRLARTISRTMPISPRKREEPYSKTHIQRGTSPAWRSPGVVSTHDQVLLKVILEGRAGGGCNFGSVVQFHLDVWYMSSQLEEEGAQRVELVLAFLSYSYCLAPLPKPWTAWVIVRFVEL